MCKSKQQHIIISYQGLGRKIEYCFGTCLNLEKAGREGQERPTEISQEKLLQNLDLDRSRWRCGCKPESKVGYNKNRKTSFRSLCRNLSEQGVGGVSEKWLGLVLPSALTPDPGWPLTFPVAVMLGSCTDGPGQLSVIRKEQWCSEGCVMDSMRAMGAAGGSDQCKLTRQANQPRGLAAPPSSRDTIFHSE